MKIEVKNVCKEFKQIPVLQDVNMTFEEVETGLEKVCYLK